MADAMPLNQRIKQIIVESLNLQGISPASIKDDEALFGAGLDLDSVDALELVVALEREFGVKIQSTEVGRSAFGSVSSLAQFLAEHGVGQETGRRHE